MHGFIHTLLPREDDNGASHGRRALVVTAVLTTISTVIVAMRFYARLGLMKITGREDWAILISLVCPSKSIQSLMSSSLISYICRNFPLSTLHSSLPVSSRCIGEFKDHPTNMDDRTTLSDGCPLRTSFQSCLAATT